MPDIPVRFPSQEVFDRVRAFFQEAGFDDAHFNHMMGELKRTAAVPKPGDLVASTEPCGSMLIRLFLGGRVQENDFLRLAGEAVLTDLRELGLIVNESPGILASSVRVRPFLDLYVLSDHFIEGKDFADDFVHAPDDANTLNYLKYISLRPCDGFLEACGGSGIAGLIAAKRCAKQAWSSDIAERSSTFARFGAALSGLGNFTAVTGDTYEPVEHLSFDRIAVHPPYIPVLRHSYIFHGGGVDGEQITRKHITDLHGRLKPGGRLYCRCAGTDRKGEPLEQRVRKWLGEHQAEYDIAMQVLGYIDPWRFLTKSVRSGRTKPEELKQWEKVFEEMGLEKLVMSVFVVQRHDSPREPFTVRREEGPFSGPRELEWLVDLETERARRGVEMVLSSRLTINPMAVLNIMHAPQEGDWQMRNQLVEVLHPHPMKFELDPLSAYVLPKLRGRMTGREVFASLIEEGVIAPDNAEEGVLNFAAGLSNLASGGFLFAEGFEPPAPVRREVEPEA